MSFNKRIKEDNALCVAHTVGDLIRNFNIDLDEYLIELLDKFPTDDEYDVTYDNYYVIELEDNTVHVFSGTANVPESPEYTVMLDLLHFRLYYIGQSNVNNSIHEYSLDGQLLSDEDYGLKQVNVDEFIRNHFIDYSCNTIGDLLVNFNLDFELSDKLKEHEIDIGSDVVFNEYFIQQYDGIDYYVFSGSFSFVAFDCMDSPVYYVDFVNQKLYEQTGGMLGVSVCVFDSNDEEIKSIELDHGYHGVMNIEKILNGDKQQ